METALRRLQLRIERSGERRGASYPWWIPAYSTTAGVALAIAAWIQRGGPAAAPTMHLALALCVCPLLVWLPRAWLMPPWLKAPTIAAAVGLFLTERVSPDLAPLLLLLIAGEVAALARLWIACVVAVAGVGGLTAVGAAGGLENAGLYAIGVVFALEIGVALRWQMRALRAERTNTRFVRESAISIERQRLAREVHDVVGHSLSINLLHVTAARHALQQHADITDAIESLVEAERVGRAAMGDLRRTVAVLAAGPGETQALPGADDIAALVERCRTAGLDVTLSRAGDPARLGAATGLGLFRIVQESLGNVARHAPTARATVSLVEHAGSVRLTIRNTLPGDPPAVGTGGTGLVGMAARADLIGAGFHAGLDGNHWQVEVTVPAAADRPSRTAVTA